MLLVCGGVLAAIMLPAVQQARTAARLTISTTHLHHIGLAAYGFHDVHMEFPPATDQMPEGTAEHSWQTALLPFLEQASLYEAIDLTSEWDDPANADAMGTEVSVYLNPAAAVPTSAYGISHYAGNEQVLGRTGITIIHIVTNDGASNTILAGEVSTGFRPWGDPGKLRDPAAGLGDTPHQFHGPVFNRTQFLMADGSVRTITDDIDPEILKALATPDGHESRH